MIRRPNKVTERAPLDLVMEFLPHEFAVLKHNPPGPTGKKGGGMQGMENYLVANTDRATLRVRLDPEHNNRLQHYIMNYGPGGPNGRMRRACIPAYRRLGIELLPEFSGARQRKQRGQDGIVIQETTD